MWACDRFHYLDNPPSGKLATYGLWEDSAFMGAIVYGAGSSPWSPASFGLERGQAVELVRVAFRRHRSPVSAAVARSLRLLAAGSPGVRVVLSLADSAQGHIGTIYQAGNWLYLGTSTTPQIRLHGRLWHPRALSRRFEREFGPDARSTSIEWLRENVDPDAARVDDVPVRYRYAMPMDRAMRRRLVRHALPYPRPRGRGLDGETPTPRVGGAGSTPADRST